MDHYEPFASLGLALLAGLLLGLEREQSRAADDTGFFGGIRTFPLVALLGALSALLTPHFGATVLGVAGLGVVALMGLSSWRGAGTGIASEVSALLTFFLGVLAAAGGVIPSFATRTFVVSAVAVAATLLLSARTELRAFTSKVSREDVLATLKFMVVAVVVLPLLPDEALGPFGALNPFNVGVMVTLIAGVNFAGYAAMRLLGPNRGMLLTGAIGGLASSTAVTLAASARARETPELAHVSALSAIIASTVMFVRLEAVLFVTNASLARAVLWPLVAMAVASAGAVVFFALRDRGHRDATSGVKLSNPFELLSAVRFGAFFIAVLLVSRWAQASFGAEGAYATALLSGLTDVDPISLSMANQLTQGAVTTQVAATTVVLAVVSNTLAKTGMALVLGGRAMGLKVLLAAGVTLAVGLLVLLATR